MTRGSTASRNPIALVRSISTFLDVCNHRGARPTGRNPIALVRSISTFSKSPASSAPPPGRRNPIALVRSISTTGSGGRIGIAEEIRRNPIALVRSISTRPNNLRQFDHFAGRNPIALVRSISTGLFVFSPAPVQAQKSSQSHRFSEVYFHSGPARSRSSAA